jgi:hypothetical protein
MPISTRILRKTTDYVDEESIRAGSNDSVAIIDTNFVSMVGAINQLSDLAKYAKGIFEDLSAISQSTNSRISTISLRVASLQQGQILTFSSVDAKIFEMPESQLLLPSSMPKSLHDLYNSPSMCRMPALGEMDRFLVDTTQREQIGSCTRGYSDPTFFFTKWRAQQERRLKELEEHRAAKKAEKKNRKQFHDRSRTDLRRGSKGSEGKPQSVNWRER